MKFEKLKNIVEVKKGKKPSFVDNPDENSVRVLQIDDLRNDTNPKFTNEKTGVFAKEDDVLIAWDGANAGTIGYGKSGYIGSTIALLRKKRPDLYSTTFIGLFLQSQYQYLRSKTTGATIPHISRKALNELEVPVISVNDQLHIANLLRKAENLIAQRKESIRLLDEFLKSTFLEMFGDPKTNEKGFEIKNLTEFYINPKDGTKCGPFGSALKKDEYTEIGIPVWTMDNILKTGEFNEFGCLFVSEEKHIELERYNARNGDIIISRAGTVGKMCIIKTEAKKSVISSNLIRLRLGKDLMPIYFYSLMKYCQSRVIKLKHGNEDAYTHMSTGVLDEINFPYPSIELQIQFAQIVEKTEALKTQYQQSLKELKSLYGSLSQKAFRGELKNAKILEPS
ncbi:MAG: restriction endonuclease subunit S [Saprospiraceae bacterium]|jgi:type I restriction enzyme S subunit|nr:restriction endonuclease subunit S [Saprospiraceae bacterium]